MAFLLSFNGWTQLYPLGEGLRRVSKQPTSWARRNRGKKSSKFHEGCFPFACSSFLVYRYCTRTVLVQVLCFQLTYSLPVEDGLSCDQGTGTSTNNKLVGWGAGAIFLFSCDECGFWITGTGILD